MASNPYVNKVEFDGQTIMDISSDTATPSDVLNGVTFHDRSGAPQTGNLITHNVYDDLDSTSTSDALSANQGRVLNEHYKIVGSSSNPVTSLDDLPLNSTGSVVLAASVSPSGVLRTHSFWKSGSSQTRWTIFVVDQYTNRTYYQVNYEGTLQGWKSIPTGVENNLTSTSTTAALSANQGRVLNAEKLNFTALGGVNANSTKTLDIANNTRAVIFTMTFDDDLSTAFTVYTTGAGVSYAYKLKASTALSINGSTANKLVISNTHTSRATIIFAIIFDGSITEA